MKFIMYHYVRPLDETLPYFRALHVDDFARQLDYFQAEFGFVTREEFQTALAGGASEHEGVVLTFDDGVKDHYRYVLPELERRGLWGIFYVPTGMYSTGKLLDVHRIHCLLGRHGGLAMIDAVRRIVSDDMLSHAHVDEFRQGTYVRQENDAATTEFKRILNYYVSYDHREWLLDQLMADRFDERTLVDEYYATPAELRDMQRRGMLIGGHSVSHPVFSKLGESEQRREIDECFRFLDAATGGLELRTFCYPYGGFHSFDATTERLLDEANCRFTLNVEPRDATGEDFRRRPQALPRYDCNAFEYGQCRPISVA